MVKGEGGEGGGGVVEGEVGAERAERGQVEGRVEVEVEEVLQGTTWNEGQAGTVRNDRKTSATALLPQCCCHSELTDLNRGLPGRMWQHSRQGTGRQGTAVQQAGYRQAGYDSTLSHKSGRTSGTGQCGFN